MIISSYVSEVERKKWTRYIALYTKFIFYFPLIAYVYTEGEKIKGNSVCVCVCVCLEFRHRLRLLLISQL